MPLELLDVPSDDAIVWRYLDFAKYIDIVSNKKLYFMRCDQLLKIDPFEGLFDEIRILEDYMDLVKDFEQFMNYAREEHPKHLFVNCWHVNENESDAMWKLYSKENGIAIRTKFGNLRKSFENTHLPVYATKIKYVDHNSLLVYDNVIDRFSVKNNAYSHENELRLLYPKPMQKDTGLLLEVDIVPLLENVIVSPMSQDWFVNLVKSVSKSFGIEENRIRKSTLYEQPKKRVF